MTIDGENIKSLNMQKIRLLSRKDHQNLKLKWDSIVLNKFANTSGLKINFTKTEMVWIGNNKML